jgi:hypothetical protein
MKERNFLPIPYFAKNEMDATAEDLQKHRLIFLYTDLEHNDVVNAHKNFREYLKASGLPERNAR